MDNNCLPAHRGPQYRKAFVLVCVSLGDLLSLQDYTSISGGGGWPLLATSSMLAPTLGRQGPARTPTADGRCPGLALHWAACGGVVVYLPRALGTADSGNFRPSITDVAADLQRVLCPL